MKLGEALNERARLAKAVSEGRDILDSCLVTQEGEAPVVTPDNLLNDALINVIKIENLVAQINKTNSATTLEDGRTLTEALAHRDGLAAQIALYEHVMRKLSDNDPYSFRRSASELKQVRHMTLGSVIIERDKLAQERRALDAQLQTLNWTTDLVE